jgi:DNA-binding NarL/FixJ family response regulator
LTRLESSGELSYTVPTGSSDGAGGTGIINVIFADPQELFHVGVAEIVGGASDICLMAQPRSTEQLLSILGTFVPHVLVLSTNFLPAFSKIEPVLQRGRTALLVLAEDHDLIAYECWLQAQGIVHRSIDGPGLIEAMRRVARGESFIQRRSSDVSTEPAAPQSRLGTEIS